MNILTNFLKSRYDRTIPYTYHAKRQVFQGDDEITIDWISDTLCGLCNFLKKKKEDPTEIIIYECFHDNKKHINKEVVIPPEVYCNENKWKPKKELCAAHQRYGTPGSEGDCKFMNKNQKTITCN
jgi:hypothetical protein